MKAAQRYTPKAQLNSQRFRCAEFDSINWKNSYAMIGCSHVFGESNKNENTIPSILTDITNTNCVNLGANGASREHTFINSLKVLAETDVKKLIILWTYSGRINIYSEDGFNMSERLVSDKISDAVRKIMLTQEHFDFLEEQYEDILKSIYKDRILCLYIRDLELEFGGIVTGDKGVDFNIGLKDYDFAPDGMHYGPIWNRRVANKIKDQIND
tara:strand:- start:78 stop:716 length:639 start_codon:yes stop_codon:yes gene_type:complete